METSPAAADAVNTIRQGFGGHASGHAGGHVGGHPIGAPIGVVAPSVTLASITVFDGCGGQDGEGGCRDTWGSGDGSYSGISCNNGVSTPAEGNGYPPIDASPPYGCASGGELSAAIETSTHPLTGAASAANAARPPPGPHIAPATRNRTPHPPPPRPEYGPDGRLLPLKLSSAAVIAAWANAPPPMPAYPQWDAGKGGYIGILLQWLDEGRLALRDTAPGVKAVKAVRMAM